MKSILYDFTPSELQILLDTSDSYSDLLRKIGLNPRGGNPRTLHKIIEKYNLDETKLNHNRIKLYSGNANTTHKKCKKSMEDVLDNKVPFYSSYNLLKRLVKEGYKDYKCEECGISSWMNKSLSLQLEHIDGNHFNNKLDNLKILCPNCHSQTDTFAGKNVNHSKSEKAMRIKYVREKVIKMPPVRREVLKKLIRTETMTEVGRRFGVTDNSIRKWCAKYNLPQKVSDIKKYTNEEWDTI